MITFTPEEVFMGRAEEYLRTAPRPPRQTIFSYLISSKQLDDQVDAYLGRTPHFTRYSSYSHLILREMHILHPRAQLNAQIHAEFSFVEWQYPAFINVPRFGANNLAVALCLLLLETPRL